jgi:hypothetical protein
MNGMLKKKTKKRKRTEIRELMLREFMLFLSESCRLNRHVFL